MTKLLASFVLLSCLMASCQAPNKENAVTTTTTTPTPAPKSPSVAVLEKKIAQIVSDKKAVVGVCILGNNGKDTVAINGDNHLPLQSVFKLHISLAVLAEIDKGKFSLEQQIKVSPQELAPQIAWSPLRDENPKGGVFSIARLIQYSIIQSDNVACDVLIRLIGSPKTVEDYFKQNNIDDIAIAFTEEVMQSTWENMFKNWSSPKATSAILQKFYENNNNLLSKNSYDFFWTTMKETTTGQKRLKGLLPQNTVVAHKTGTSGTNKEGITAATNDVGIVFLPNGAYFIISVFVSDSKESDETNEKIIAEIAKAAYDFYTGADIK
jgi:beta-lactamase class A